MPPKQQPTLQFPRILGMEHPVEKLTSLLTRYPKISALIAGAVSAFGFVPFGVWPLLLLGLAALIYLTSKALGMRGAAAVGWCFGVGHFAVSNQWIAVTFTFQSEMPVWLGYIAVVALALYLAVYPAMAAAGAWKLGDLVRARGGKPTIPFALSFAAMWTITEWLRSWVFTGYVWNPLSVAMIDIPGAGIARAIGTYGMSGLTVLLSAILLGLIGAVLTMQWKAAFARVLDAALLAGACTGLGALAAGNTLPDKRQAVTIVQPNISQADKYEAGYDEVNFAKLAAYSKPLSGQGPRLLLWPEAAIPDYLESGYPYRYYQMQPGGSAVGARMRLQSLMGTGDILLTGATRLVIDKQGQLIAARNSMIAMDDTGRLRGTYDKSHLVPYGEYLPLPGLLKTLGLNRLVPGDLDFWPGPGPQTLELGTAKVGFQVCYEIIFSGQTVSRTNRPDFIFNSSNDAWFGRIGPPQHLAQAQLRALEEGLPMLRATPTGISAIIDADGVVLKRLPLGTAGRIDGFVPVSRSPTWFAQLGNIVSLAFAALLLAIALLPVVRRRTSR
jgi:apolipoprotein N-acyltransferase